MPRRRLGNADLFKNILLELRATARKARIVSAPAALICPNSKRGKDPWSFSPLGSPFSFKNLHAKNSQERNAKCTQKTHAKKRNDKRTQNATRAKTTQKNTQRNNAETQNENAVTQKICNDKSRTHKARPRPLRWPDCLLSFICRASTGQVVAHSCFHDRILFFGRTPETRRLDLFF